MPLQCKDYGELRQQKQQIPKQVLCPVRLEICTTSPEYLSSSQPGRGGSKTTLDHSLQEIVGTEQRILVEALKG